MLGQLFYFYSLAALYLQHTQHLGTKTTPGARMRVSHVSLTMAEYFRDALHQDVLIFIDNVFRFLQAGSEVSTLLGRMPSCTEMGSIQERIVATKLGSITSIQAIFVPADDLTDPAPAIIFGHKIVPEGLKGPEGSRSKEKDAILATN